MALDLPWSLLTVMMCGDAHKGEWDAKGAIPLGGKGLRAVPNLTSATPALA